jgi:hypothetical protein
VQSAARNAGAQGMDPNAKAIDVTQETTRFRAWTAGARSPWGS